MDSRFLFRKSRPGQKGGPPFFVQTISALGLKGNLFSVKKGFPFSFRKSGFEIQPRWKVGSRFWFTKFNPGEKGVPSFEFRKFNPSEKRFSNICITNCNPGQKKGFQYLDHKLQTRAKRGFTIYLFFRGFRRCQPRGKGGFPFFGSGSPIRVKKGVPSFGSENWWFENIEHFIRCWFTLGFINLLSIYWNIVWNDFSNRNIKDCFIFYDNCWNALWWIHFLRSIIKWLDESHLCWVEKKCPSCVENPGAFWCVEDPGKL